MATWLKDAVFYEIYPQSFKDTNGDGYGDIEGIIQSLDYIADLGCNALWINPWYVSPFGDAGYDVADYKQVAPRYGTNADAERLFAEAHKLGMRVLLDLVPGHTSLEHPWFVESSRPERNEYSDRYVWSRSCWEQPERYRFIAGTTKRDGAFMVNFFAMQPALNYGFYQITEGWQQPMDAAGPMATREAMKDVCRYWLNMGADGFRVDMAESLVKNDPDRIGTRQVWRDILGTIHSEYPESAFVSEWSCPEKALDCGFDMDFYLDHPGEGYHELTRNIDYTGDMADTSFFRADAGGDASLFLRRYIEDVRFADAHSAYLAPITCNHDTPRLAPRLSERELELCYAMLLTLKGVPYIYYGDEIMMPYVEGLTSVEGGYNRTGSRQMMDWDRAGQGELYRKLQELIALRHRMPDLQADSPIEIVRSAPYSPVIIYKRGGCTIALNTSTKPADISISGELLYSIGEVGDPQSFVIFH